MARIPPHNIEAEMAVLGSVMIGGRKSLDRIPWLTPGDFYREAHGAIFDSFGDLSKISEVDIGDIVVMKDHLTKKGELDKVGGYQYLMQLAEYVPTPANVVYYSQIVLAKSNLRRLIAKASEIATLAYSEPDDVESLAIQAEASFADLVGRGADSSVSSSSETTSEYLDIMESRANGQSKDVWHKTGIDSLDRTLRGFRNSTLNIVAARPSIGKSALLLQIAHNMAKTMPVLYVTIEMPKHDNMDRLVAQLSRIDPYKILSGAIDEGTNEYRAFIRATKQIDKSQLHWMDKPNVLASQIDVEARRMRGTTGLGAIFVDYLQYMDTPEGMERNDKRLIVGANSRSLKMVARSLKIPVVVASQLNRGVENRDDKTPELRDLAESGNIEQDADSVVFIDRPEFGKKRAEGKSYMEPEPARLVIAKNRSWRTGIVELQYTPALTLFHDKTGDLGV